MFESSARSPFYDKRTLRQIPGREKGVAVDEKIE